MQSPTIVHGVSFRQEPRRGQIEVFNAIKDHPQTLNIKLPTGYGKTAAMIGVYAILQLQGRVNRLLAIFPTEAQRDQFEREGHKDCENVDLPGSHKIIDLSYFSASEVLKRHRTNEAQIFAITIQSLIESRGMQTVQTLMQSGQWMVTVDEYHHYGDDKTWSRAVLSLNRQYLLAMSATPSRPGDDSAFGKPHVEKTYRQAVEEGAVKRLHGHSYNYKIDAIDTNGDLISFTTAELVKEAGSDAPDRIEKYRIKHKMRWSPKYISPLVSHPIERMDRKKLETGRPLQAIIFAMCVSHAEVVCVQVRSMFPTLNVDWVGTGENGRTDKENDVIIKRFQPEKDEYGNRPQAEIDVLVNVGIAGEGLDTFNVSELIYCCSATLCNRNNQRNGRASRYLDGVVGNINFDAATEFATKGYVGEAIMDAMDFNPPDENRHHEDCDCNLCKSTRSDEIDPLPEEPNIGILNMELLNIDSGHPGVQQMAQVMERRGAMFDWPALRKDRKHPDWQQVIEDYRTMRAIEAEPNNEKAIVQQWDDAVKIAVRSVTGRVIRHLVKNGTPVEKSLAGDIAKRINTRKKRDLGGIELNLEVLRRHYQWLLALEKELREGRTPLWLL